MTPEDRFGDLGPSEPTAAERFSELDEGDMEAERRQRDRPGPARPGGRYTWVVGVAALIVVIVVAFNSLPNAGRGYRGPAEGKRMPVFAAPLATSDVEGDANVKQDAKDKTAGNDTPACDVDLPGVVTTCDLKGVTRPAANYSAGRESLGGGGGLGVGPHDDGVGHRDDLVSGKVGARGVLADRLGARRLVDADGSDLPRLLAEHVGPDPPDVVGHLVVADIRGAGRGLL